MALFLARVELQRAEHISSAYTQLHEAMANAGFQRFAHYSDGDYWLPTGLYIVEAASLTCTDVRKKATQAVESLGYSFQSFVCEIYGGQFCSSGLQKKQ